MTDPFDKRTQLNDIGATPDELLRLGLVEGFTRQQEIDEELMSTVSTMAANYDPVQVKELMKQDLNWLAAVAMPDVFQYKFPPVLLAAWYLLCENIEKVEEDPKIGLGIPRGFAKTTLIKLFIFRCILFTEIDFILIISATATLAENVMADVFDMLGSANVKTLFGYWQLGSELDRQDLKKFHFLNHDIICAAVGAEGSLRGINIKNRRPSLMVFDDVQTKECAQSVSQSTSLFTWMLGTAMKAKSPRGCMYIFSGNMYPGDNSILKKLRGMATWIKFISGAILADGSSLWPEHRSLPSLILEFEHDIEAGHPEIFLSEVMNDTEAGINTKVDISAIKMWPWAEADQPQGKMIIIDPSTDKMKSDSVAIGYFEVFDEVPGLKIIIEETLSPGNIIRRALLLAMQTGTRCIIVEANAFQYTLLYWFQQLANELGITGFHFVPIYSTSISKNTRITTGLKELTAGEIVLHSSIKSQVTHQIVNWNPLKRDNVDNILDLISYGKRAVQEYAPLIMTDTHLLVLEAQGAEVMEDNHAF